VIMEETKKICPNCGAEYVIGAENQYGAMCEYCGSPLQDSDSHITLGCGAETQPHFLNDGKYNYFKETFDSIEKVTQTQTTNIRVVGVDTEIYSRFYRECTSSGKEHIFLVFQVPCSPFRIVSVGKSSGFNNYLLSHSLTLSQYQEKIGQSYGVESYFSGNPISLVFNLKDKRYSIKPTRLEKTKTNSGRTVDSVIYLSLECEEWDVFFEIDKDLLHALCEIGDIGAPQKGSEDLWISLHLNNSIRTMKGLEVRISFDDSQSLSLTIPILKDPARLLYNRLFDDSAYMDTLIGFQNRLDWINNQQEAKIEKKKKDKEMQEAQIAQREKWAKEFNIIRSVQEKRRKVWKAIGIAGTSVSLLLIIYVFGYLLESDYWSSIIILFSISIFSYCVAAINWKMPIILKFEDIQFNKSFYYEKWEKEGVKDKEIRWINLFKISCPLTLLLLLPTVWGTFNPILLIIAGVVALFTSVCLFKWSEEH